MAVLVASVAASRLAGQLRPKVAIVTAQAAVGTAESEAGLLIVVEPGNRRPRWAEVDPAVGLMARLAVRGGETMGGLMAGAALRVSRAVQHNPGAAAGDCWVTALAGG